MTPQTCSFELISCINKGCMYVCIIWSPRIFLTYIVKNGFISVVILHWSSNVNLVRRLRKPCYCVNLVAVLVQRPVLIDTPTLSKLSY